MIVIAKEMATARGPGEGQEKDNDGRHPFSWTAQKEQIEAEPPNFSVQEKGTGDEVSGRGMRCSSHGGKGQSGYESLSEVKHVVMEGNGNLSIIPKKNE